MEGLTRGGGKRRAGANWEREIAFSCCCKKIVGTIERCEKRDEGKDGKQTTLTNRKGEEKQNKNRSNRRQNNNKKKP